jgi:hypothetical protein
LNQKVSLKAGSKEVLPYVTLEEIPACSKFKASVVAKASIFSSGFERGQAQKTAEMLSTFTWNENGFWSPLNETIGKNTY